MFIKIGLVHYEDIYTQQRYLFYAEIFCSFLISFQRCAKAKCSQWSSGALRSDEPNALKHDEFKIYNRTDCGFSVRTCMSRSTQEMSEIYFSSQIDCSALTETAP